MNNPSWRRAGTATVAAALAALGTLLLALLVPTQSAQAAGGPAPTVTATRTNNGATFSWTPIKNATGYDVRDYNCTLNGGNCGKPVPDRHGRTTTHYGPNVTSLDFRVAKTTGVKVKVRTTFKRGTSQWGAAFMVVNPKQPPKPTKLPTPYNVMVRWIDGLYVVTWNADPSDAKFFQVYNQDQFSNKVRIELFQFVPAIARSYTSSPGSSPGAQTAASCFAVRAARSQGPAAGPGTGPPEDFSDWGNPAPDQNADLAFPSSYGNYGPDTQHMVCAKA